MPISFQTSATGVRSAGSTFTIALSSTAGDQIIVVVATSSNGRTVSSITDGGGNHYSKKGSLVNGTTVNVELWASDKAHPAASGTITVTLSASGVGCGVAASYRGVDIVTIPAASSTASTSPITSGSITLKRLDSWVVMAGGLAAANAFTASSGSLRNQITSTSVAAVLIDSNGASTPVTDSATMTAAAWAQVNVQLWAGITAPVISGDVDNEAEDGMAVSVPFKGSKYKRAEQDFTAPPKFGSIPSVAMFGWDRLPVATPALVKPSYYKPQLEFVAPPKFGSIPSVAMLQWPAQIPYNELENYYVMGEAESGPYASVLFSLLGSWIPDFPYRRVPTFFSQYAGDTRNLLTPAAPAIPLISGWHSTDGKKSVILKYQQPGFVKPVLQPAIPFAGPFISGWQSQESYVELENYYTMGQVESGPSAAVPINISSWFGTDGSRAVSLRYTSTTWDAPAKFGLVTAASSNVAAWVPVETHFVVSPYFVMGEEEAGPFVGTLVTLNSWEFRVDGNKAVSLKYSPTTWDAPAKFGIVVVATPTLASWTSTTGKEAVKLKYAPPDWFAPPKFGLVTVAAPTIAAWQSQESYVELENYYTMGQAESGPSAATSIPILVFGLAEITRRANPNKYASTTWDAPPKFGLVTVVASTIAAWQPGFLFTELENYYVMGQADSGPSAALSAAVTTLAGWSPVTTYTPKFEYYALGDTATGPAAIFGATFAFSSAITGHKSVSKLRYAASEWSAPPKFGLVSILTPTVASWSPTTGPQSVVLKYASTAFDAPAKFGIVAVITPTLASWSSTIGSNSVKLKYALSDYTAPSKFGLVTPVASSLASWQSQDLYVELENYYTMGQAESGPAAVLSIPLLLFGLAEFTPKSLPNKYASTTWDAPPKFGLIAVATPTLVGWSPVVTYAPKFDSYALGDTATGPAVIFAATFAFPSANLGQLSASKARYALSSWDAPSKFSIVAAPPTLSSWTPTTGQPPVVLRYASTAWDAPPKFGLTAPAAPNIAGWSSTIGQRNVVLKYAASEFVNQVAPPVLPLPSLASDLVKTIAFVKYRLYSRSVSETNPTFQLSTILLPWLDDKPWSTYNKYLQSNIVGQLNPTLTTLPILLFGLAEVPPESQKQVYASTTYDAPAKFGIITVVAETIASWLPTVGQQAVSLKYASTTYDAPAKFGLVVVATPTLASWTSTIGRESVKLKYASTTYDAPPKFGIIVPATSNIAGWNFVDATAPKFDFYAQGDTATGPAVIFAATFAFASAVAGQQSLPQKYVGSDSILPLQSVAPIIIPLFINNLAEPAAPPVVLKYALSEWVAPPKFGLIVAALPTLASWTPTIGQQAVVPSKAFSSWEAPPKFGLIVAVLPTLESWTPTIGQKSLPQAYASPSWDAPGKFGLIFIPIVVITRGCQFYKLINVTTDFYKVAFDIVAFDKLVSATSDFNKALFRKFLMGGKLKNTFFE